MKKTSFTFQIRRRERTLFLSEIRNEQSTKTFTQWGFSCNPNNRSTKTLFHDNEDETLLAHRSLRRTHDDDGVPEKSGKGGGNNLHRHYSTGGQYRFTQKLCCQHQLATQRGDSFATEGTPTSGLCELGTICEGWTTALPHCSRGRGRGNCQS